MSETTRRQQIAKDWPFKLKQAANVARGNGTISPYNYPVAPPTIAPGVLPPGASIAMDAAVYDYARTTFPGGGFPGYPYLSQLATRAEYRQMAATFATEMTREWIKFHSEQNSEKVAAIETAFDRLRIRDAVRTIIEHDCYFGRGQLFVNIRGQDRDVPLILDSRTVRQGSLVAVTPVEPYWTTPNSYNAVDPAAADFYRPTSWYMLGQKVHASRLLTMISRPLPDILKPAFNFAGMSLSQLAEPYVDNWLRTRQSVADLINNFSITVLATSMDQVLQDADSGADLLARVDLFKATRSNQGVALLDKDREEIVQINTPLSGLHELQAQAQEHMCSVSRTPAIILTGISPSGLNASSDGEIRVYYDWIAAQQENYMAPIIDVLLKLVQLDLFGEIDPGITYEFVPLYQMTDKDRSDIRLQDSQSDINYVNAGVLDPSEVRNRLASEPDSGYKGIDVDAVPLPPGDPMADMLTPQFGEETGDV